MAGIGDGGVTVGQKGRDRAIADPGLAEQGARRIEWADHAMPVLRRIRTQFATERPLAGLTISACLHVTAETAALVRVLLAGGAHVFLAASNPLSTQDEVAAALAVRYGAAVFARADVDRATYYRNIHQAIEAGPDLVLDDGCDLVNTLHGERADLVSRVRGGCESTTTGVFRLRGMAAARELGFPMIAANDTPVKRMSDNRYGTGQSVLDGILRATNTLLAGRTVVVAGYGYCGKGLAERARGLGAQVIVTEINPAAALDAVMQGFRVLPMARAAPIGDVFITATGNRDVIAGEHFAVMRSGAILANAGHFDVEVDIGALQGQAVTVNRAVRPDTDEYVLPGQRRLLLLAEGRLVNLVAAEGHPPAVMDLSFATQALATAWLAGHHDGLAPGVHDVPAEIDAEVARLALASLDVEIDALTPAQQDYLESWRYGS
ncbi:MAG TPA: adenosylhomocysteinase [Streptosporangiaceae bacterium]|nr:adenosylhomocysteinase [Streptosporangiaceae bacterium]